MSSNPVPVESSDAIVINVRNSFSGGGNLPLFGTGRGRAGRRHRYRSSQPYALSTREKETLTYSNIGWNGSLDTLWVQGSPITTKRGQTYLTGFLIDMDGKELGPLFAGYKTSEFHVPLGFFEPEVSGRGFIHNKAIASNIAPVDIQHTLGIANALRKINGFIWYYHCSGDVATRTLRVTMRDMGDGLPTGMTSGPNTRAAIWPSAAGVSLAANQEALIYVNATEGKSFAVSKDQGSGSIEDITTVPDPFPYWAQENDVCELFFDVTDEEAADRHSIYIIEEEWISV